jgi:hypothetical protein
MSSLDAMLDRMQFADMLGRCTDKGVTERPPIAGNSYVAFAVHPPQPGKLLAVAIAHRQAGEHVLDVIRSDISIAAAAALFKRYNISLVTGAESEGDGLDLAHATVGAFALLGAH